MTKFTYMHDIIVQIQKQIKEVVFVMHQLTSSQQATSILIKNEYIEMIGATTSTPILEAFLTEDHHKSITTIVKEPKID